MAIGLGCNLGDRFDNLVRALTALGDRVGTLLALSRIYLTEPIGIREQPDFWNAAALFLTKLGPMAVFDHAKHIERELGRSTTVPGGPRNIDIDVLLYDDVVMSTSQLEIPHPRLHQRAFVLRPLAEIAPAMVHPQLRANIEVLRERVAAQRAAPLDRESEALRAALGLRRGGEA